MEFNAAVRRLLACAGGMLSGAVLGAEFISPEGSVKALFAGLGVGVTAAALVRDNPT